LVAAFDHRESSSISPDPAISHAERLRMSAAAVELAGLRQVLISLAAAFSRSLKAIPLALECGPCSISTATSHALRVVSSRPEGTRSTALVWRHRPYIRAAGESDDQLAIAPMIRSCHGCGVRPG